MEKEESDGEIKRCMAGEKEKDARERERCSMKKKV